MAIYGNPHIVAHICTGFLQIGKTTEDPLYEYLDAYWMDSKGFLTDMHVIFHHHYN